jgi:hypothetical protein
MQVGGLDQPGLGPDLGWSLWPSHLSQPHGGPEASEDLSHSFQLLRCGVIGSAPEKSWYEHLQVLVEAVSTPRRCTVATAKCIVESLHG